MTKRDEIAEAPIGGADNAGAPALEIPPAPRPEAHHPHGMSQWPAIMACACFEGRGDSADAALGTAIHAKLAGWLAAAKRTGELRAEAVDNLTLHERGALDAAEAILAEAGALRDRIHVEHRCTLDNGVFGTADAVLADRERRRITVWDFKTFYNPGRDYYAQLAGYGLAVAQKLLRGPWCGMSTDNITLRLRVLYGDTPVKSDSTEMPLASAAAIAHAALARFRLREEGKAEPSQCNWCDICRHQAACPALREVVEATQGEAPLAQAFRAWADLSPTIKAQLLVVAEQAAKWADAVRAAAKADAVNGVALEDPAHGVAFALRQVAGRKKPRVADLWPVLFANGVKAEDFKAKLSISATDAEGLLKSVGVRAKDAKAAVAQVCDVGPGATQLVRA